MELGAPELIILFVVLCIPVAIVLAVVGLVRRNARPAPRQLSVADELAKLDALRSNGQLSEEEYQRLRSRLIG